MNDLLNDLQPLATTDVNPTFVSAWYRRTQSYDVETSFAADPAGFVAGVSSRLTFAEEISFGWSNRNSLSVIAHHLLNVSSSTGGAVIVSPEYRYLPAILGKDNEPVFLFELVESIEAFIDYKQLQEDFPTLSMLQLVGGVNFVRRAMQFNDAGIDIDRLEDEVADGTAEVQDAILRALAAQEATRVLGQ
jgi:hypothetical protein